MQSHPCRNEPVRSLRSSASGAAVGISAAEVSVSGEVILSVGTAVGVAAMPGGSSLTGALQAVKREKQTAVMPDKNNAKYLFFIAASFPRSFLYFINYRSENKHLCKNAARSFAPEKYELIMNNPAQAFTKRVVKLIIF